MSYWFAAGETPGASRQVTYYMDTDADKNSLPTSAVSGTQQGTDEVSCLPCGKGSKALSIASGKVFMLNSNDEWGLLGAGGSETSPDLSSSPMEFITWYELRLKRNNSILIPGMQYRITDYICTTTQDDTRVVSHPYDIIVVADDSNTLNESARACLHSEDNYYIQANGYPINLKAWELKYCIDNDVDRFSWVDPDNGRGVVYYLKDEHGNECPYDFKQIQFKRYKITQCDENESMVGCYTTLQSYPEALVVDENNPMWFYTFSYYDQEETEIINIQDATLLESTFENKIENDYPILNNIVFIGRCRANVLKFGCESITFGDNCDFNSFGCRCSDNTLGDNCYKNTFIGGCESNILGENSSYNILGENSSYNILGENSSYNILGNDCYNIILVSQSINNIFGDGCSIITTETANDKIVQLYNVLGGTSSDNIVDEEPIIINGRSRSIHSVQYVGINSDGKLITWNPADNYSNEK